VLFTFCGIVCNHRTLKIVIVDLGRIRHMNIAHKLSINSNLTHQFLELMSYTTLHV
jgi:hypothetical protein